MFYKTNIQARPTLGQNFLHETSKSGSGPYKLIQKEDHLLTKIFNRISNELEAMGAVTKKVFWQVAEHFLDINKEKEIRTNPEISKAGVREEVRAEEILKTKVAEAQNAISHSANEKLDFVQPTTTSSERSAEPLLRKSSVEWAKQGNETSQPVLDACSQQTIPEPTETNFSKLTRLCEQRLYDYLDRHKTVREEVRAEQLLQDCCELKNIVKSQNNHIEKVGSSVVRFKLISTQDPQTLSSATVPQVA